MEQYKKEFIEFMIDCQVLKFGDFVTKSGRKTPFFVNTGFYRTGSQLRRLGAYYAQAIRDKGILLGSPVKDGDKVVIIEDVTTAGTSIGETMPILKAQGAVDVLGLVVSVDRCERGQGEKSALQEVSETYGMKTCAIVTMKEVVEHLWNNPYNGKVIIDDELKGRIDDYYRQYGIGGKL